MQQSKSFFEIVDNPELFEFGKLNLSKLFYDSHVNKQREKLEPKLVGKFFEKNNRILFWLTSLFYKIPKAILTGKFKKRKFLLADSGTGRTSIIHGKPYDLYNANVVDSLGRENVFILSAKPAGERTYSEDLSVLDFDFITIPLAAFLGYVYNRKKYLAFAHRLLDAYPELGFKTDEIIVLLMKFQSRYILFKSLIKILKIKKVILWCHYFAWHPLTAVCKEMDIPVIELMHGHIMKSHPFYNPIGFRTNFIRPFRDFLLPDLLGVYGEYWRDNLFEYGMFDPQALKIAGYYLKQPEKHQQAVDATDKKIILITSQPYVQKEILQYVDFLRENLDQESWKVVLKPHSNEDVSIYNQYQIAGFIDVSFESVYSLLERTSIHISVYSTVLFEAIFYPLTNYSLFVPKVQEQCDEIVMSGIANRLHLDETPVELARQAYRKEYYFAPSQLERILELDADEINRAG